MDVIEPSEIFIDNRGAPKRDVTHVNPWVRLLARFFDYALFFALLLILRPISHQLQLWDHLIPVEFFAWIPIEALLLSTWGTTPGKFFLKTHLRQGQKKRLSYWTALKRSFNVWFRGLGMGIPIINFLCLLVAYQKLILLKKTSWDLEEHILVTHHLIGRWRIYTAAVVIVAGFLAWYRN